MIDDRLAAVTRAVGTLELDPFLQMVIAAAGECTGSEVVAILEYDERGKALRYLAVPPALESARREPPMPLDQSAAAMAIRERRSVQFPDDAADSAILANNELRLTAVPRTLLVVPLVLAGRAIGVLEAANKNQAHYTEEDVTILETLAVLAALAIEHAALTHRLEASLTELAELDRLKSDFIAITSHELRTPLGVILGHATYLRELLGADQRQQVDAIVKNASRLKEIVDSLASMDNYGTGRARVRPQAVSMAHIVQEVVASFESLAAEQQIALEASPISEDLMVEAEPTKISIALGNLVKNAITFTNSGGHIWIQTEAVPGYVKVSVIDDGIGIPRKDLPRVFDRFFQVEGHLTRRHNGMGLGLSVAKVMVEMHGGRIWVESIEGRGSTFSFLLPVQAAETQPSMF